jgi:regulator of sigma E protease
MGILITIHEAAHFYTGKIFNFKILKFSIGFPILGLKPILYKKGKDGVEYELHCFLFGGFVKFLDKRVHSKEDNELLNLKDEDWNNEFTSKSLWKKYLVVLAGPLSNIVLCFVLLFGLLFNNGVFGLRTTIESVNEQSWSYNAGLVKNDQILKINNKDTILISDFFKEYKTNEKENVKILIKNLDSNKTRTIDTKITEKITRSSGKTFSELTGINFVNSITTNQINEVFKDSWAEKEKILSGDWLYSINEIKIKSPTEIKEIKNNIKNDFEITFISGDNKKTKIINYESFIKNNKILGFSFSLNEKLYYKRDYSLIEALDLSVHKTKDSISFIITMLGKMVTGEEKVKDNISGPFTISKTMGDNLQISIDRYIYILALFSLSLGIMNLLPIPTLDGGHLIMYKIEAIIRRPVPAIVEQIVYGIGAFIVFSFMIYSIYIDILRYI